VLSGVLPAAAAAGATPGAYDLLQSVREAYSALGSYADEGEIELLEDDGARLVERSGFRLTMGGDGELELELDGGDEAAVRYDEIGEELEHALGDGALQALVVAALLGSGSDALGEPSAALIEDRVDCDGSTCWLLFLAGPGPGSVRRLWIDTGTFLLHRVEADVLRDPPRLWRVEHRILAARGRGETATGQPPAATFSESLEVALSTLPVRVLDRSGAAVPDLGAGDFRLLVDGRESPIEAAVWIDASRPLAEAERAELEAAGVAAPPDGQLVVLFVQTSLHGSRLVGQVRMLPHAQRFIDRLGPWDRAAVVSFDSHLKLRQDFTRDRNRVRAALERSLVAGPAPPPRPESALSMARSFEADAALAATTPERALELTARALIPIPGEKTLVYLGWGLGRLGSHGVEMTERYDDALRALAAARTTVFVLDVSDSDYHSLEVGLRQVAADTGGTYAKTHLTPGAATDRLASALDGHYLLYFHRPEGADARRLQVELRDRRRGEVLVPSLTFP